MVRASAVCLVAACWLAVACSDPGADSVAIRPSSEPTPASSHATSTESGPADPGACPPLTPGSPLADLNLVDRFVWYALPDLPDGAPLASVRALGKLPFERVRHLDNEYDPGQKIEERTLVFDGLEVTGQVAAGQKFMRWHAKVTRPGWRIRDGLGVGASVKELARVLGCANSRSGDVLSYSGETESVQFTVRDGRITAVELFDYHE